jgi:hypothetical protein
MAAVGDAAARKARICGPVPDGKTYVGVFCRREKSESGHPRYYLFTPDEDLELAAECRAGNDLRFSIALGSVNFGRDANPLYLGEMTRFGASATYSVTLGTNVGEKAKVLDIRYLCRGEKRPFSASRSVVVTPIGEVGDQAPLMQMDFRESIARKFPGKEQTAVVSEKNLFLGGADGSHRFSLAKIDDDEYHFAVSGGLSVFQGFCIAATAFYRVRYEK